MCWTSIFGPAELLPQDLKHQVLQSTELLCYIMLMVFKLVYASGELPGKIKDVAFSSGCGCED